MQEAECVAVEIVGDSTLGTTLEELAPAIRQADEALCSRINECHEMAAQVVLEARGVGALLGQVKTITGAKGYRAWLQAELGEDFLKRSCKYERALTADPRQLALNLGVVPKSEKPPAEERVTHCPQHMQWINKLMAYLGRTEDFNPGERLAMEGLSRRLEIVLRPPGKESIA
ncbi:MAG: hypothetical protein AAFX93_19975 [Verrucomicrobiota bacterium]